ncbi:hypothetical protein LCGC14_2546610, partial [marine sediment metagenome]
KITDRYAIYNGDCVKVIPNFKNETIHLSCYSPPFSDLYNYSSDEADMSNCSSYEQFLAHYEYLVREIFRLTVPGRITAVHCTDIKITGTNSAYRDFPGDIIRLHNNNGFYYQSRHCIWKEPLRVAIRTRALGLMHRQIVKDSSLCHVAAADYVLIFRKQGKNLIPIEHPTGLSIYAGLREVDPVLLSKYKDWKEQKTNKLSHWIWQQYASAFWDDIDVKNVLPYREARDSEEEKHVCPLQLDVIERIITLYSNENETILTPFMGVGSEVYQAVKMGRRAVGIELKPSYYRQAIQNINHANDEIQKGLFDEEPIDIKHAETRTD